MIICCLLALILAHAGMSALECVRSVLNLKDENPLHQSRLIQVMSASLTPLLTAPLGVYLCAVSLCECAFIDSMFSHRSDEFPRN